MADIIYADATLITGANDGTSWEDAYQGVAGFQTAIDSHNGANETHMFIRNDFLLTSVGIDVDKSRTGYTSNKWLRIVGCDADGGPLPIGQYVNIDMNNLSSVLYGIKIDSISWDTELKNIRCFNGAAGKTGISLRGSTVSSRYNYILNNVATDDVDYGIWVGNSYASNERLYNFVLFDCCITADIQAVKSNTDNWLLQHVENCFFKNNNNTYPVVSDARTGYGAWLFCVFIGGTYALHNSFATGPNCYCCLFYHQSEGAFYHQYGAGKYINVNVTNSIFYLLDNSKPNIILATNGNIGKVEYNAGNSINVAKWGAGTPEPINYMHLDSSPFVDGDNSDFRLVPNSSLLNKGLPIIIQSNQQGFSSTGAWQRKSILTQNSKGIL